MSDKHFQQLLNQAVPDVPEKFHHAMTSVLEKIEAEETAALPDNVILFSRRTGKRRAALIILAAALLTATIAVAAVAGRDVFSVFWGENVQMQEDFRSIIRHDVAEAFIGDYRVRVDEAAYDGVCLYIKYSIRDMTIEHLLGTVKKSRKGAESRVFTYEDDVTIGQWPVSLWQDGFWLNGEYISIPAESSGYHEPGGMSRARWSCTTSSGWTTRTLCSRASMRSPFPWDGGSTMRTCPGERTASCCHQITTCSPLL